MVELAAQRLYEPLRRFTEDLVSGLIQDVLGFGFLAQHVCDSPTLLHLWVKLKCSMLPDYTTRPCSPCEGHACFRLGATPKLPRGSREGPRRAQALGLGLGPWPGSQRSCSALVDTTKQLPGVEG